MSCRLSLFLAAALIGGAFVTRAGATLLVSDPFSYPDGDLVGNTPPVGPSAWATHSGTTGPVQVTGGQIAVVEASGATQDVNIPLGVTMGAGDVMYSSFDLTVPDPGAAITNVYFAHFLAGTSSFDARIWITTPTTAGYRLALSNDNSDTDGDGEVFTGDLAFGTTYKIVTRYDFDAKSGKLWIDPVSEASPSFDATDPGFSDAITAYAFRQGGGSETLNIDNLNVGTTFADAVPEPASVGLLAGAALLLARRRRQQG